MNTRTTDPTELAESVEAEMMYRYETNAPDLAQEGLGIATTRMGGGVVLSARVDPFDYWSKALGFGFAEPVTHDLVDRVVAFYREQGTPTAVLQVAPSVLPPDWAQIQEAHGLQAAGSWLKLAAPIGDVRAEARTDLRVGPVGEADAHEWASVVSRAFGMEIPAMVAMLAESVRHPAATPFAAWDGDTIVAGANLYVHGTVASLNSGATLPDHRGRGAQSALIAARLAAARAAGAGWVVAETGAPAPGEVNQSLANLQRAGLQVRYARQNWRWRA
ncbi:GNAT family N-acetyltransferase [Promicromonospora sp. NPDC060204]|uniref:GNAT family N-acetyltransferase n=1 Tax=Promicromonospora sp. NPDC060204 TaxID=3347071 RepID=UPI0036556285